MTRKPTSNQIAPLIDPFEVTHNASAYFLLAPEGMGLIRGRREAIKTHVRRPFIERELQM
jgi:hypothetical protein